jgi:hypothetical protein
VFRSRFRRNAFGWRSQPAIKRIKEAVSEIRKVSKKDPVLSAEGAVLFLEKVAPALEQVDSSSGAIGSAVNRAIDVLAKIIADAPVDLSVRMKWLERLWQALEEDRMPYIELLEDHWGDLCGDRDIAYQWAESLEKDVRTRWAVTKAGGPFIPVLLHGDQACLSCLLKAEKYQEVLDLLEYCPYSSWGYRVWGVRALLGSGRKAEALSYAENSAGPYVSEYDIAVICEEILLSSGMAEEAYKRYALEANVKNTYLATFNAIAKKYSFKDKREILHDLVSRSSGEEGKWFAAARSAELYDEALWLARSSPCDPKTLSRAARDAVESNPQFAIEVGIASLMWMVRGYGYELTGMDVISAFNHTMEGAARAGTVEKTILRLQDLVRKEEKGETEVLKIIEEKINRLV